ncbi:MAG: S46 family peptidase [Bacteroidetes bacterium]|nr:S46 family peptidase [Bacteroidota bacterium]
MANRRVSFFIVICITVLAVQASAQQDDPRSVNGRMWTFDYPPMEHFKAAYDFVPDAAWLEDVRMSALRFGGGCSASFVSPEGLVMTNFHCGLESVAEVTRPGEDLRREGFYAATLEDERKVPDLYVDQLMKIQDVTQEIIAAMRAAEDAEQAFAARDKAIAEITKRLTTDDLRCEVVTFFNGARFSAYLYKRFDDVRLVFSSELNFAFFGGIYDFWAYPRYSFDCDMFRVYDDGKPLKTEHYYSWSRGGAKENDPVFVVGNPGRTNRLVTADMLAYERDANMPNLVQMVTDRKEVLETWIRQHPEEGDAWFDELFGIVNAQEAYAGRLIGLRDDELMAKRQAFDDAFRTALKNNSTEWSRYGDLWSDIRKVTAGQREIAHDLYGLRTAGFGVSSYMARAAMIVNWIEQMAKPDAERDKRFQGSSGDLMGRILGKPVEVALEMDKMTLARQLRRMQRMLGNDDPVMRQALAGGTPEEAAARLLNGTFLKDSAAIAVVLEQRSLDGTDDPLISMVQLMMPRYQAATDRARELGAKQQVLTNKLGDAQYAVYGSSIPPDATFTLRISDGIVTGYPYNGTVAPPYTTFYGMYDHYYSFKDSKEAWDAMMGGNAWALPERWKNPPASFDLATPMNFISTTDIIGGNSGSAIINRNREVVGLAFDGNIESLAGAYIFAPEKGNRTIGVHSEGIIQALRHVYNAGRIVDEIERGRRR